MDGVWDILTQMSIINYLILYHRIIVFYCILSLQGPICICDQTGYKGIYCEEGGWRKYSKVTSVSVCHKAIGKRQDDSIDFCSWSEC